MLKKISLIILCTAATYNSNLFSMYEKRKTRQSCCVKITTVLSHLIGILPKLPKTPEYQLESALMQTNRTLLAKAIDQGANVNHILPMTAVIPLIVAVERGDDHFIAPLLQAGARIDQANADGKTALHIACGLGYVHCVKELMKGNPNLNIACHAGLTAGLTAYEVALGCGYTDCAELLFQAKQRTDTLKQALEQEKANQARQRQEKDQLWQQKVEEHERIIAQQNLESLNVAKQEQKKQNDIARQLYVEKQKRRKEIELRAQLIKTQEQEKIRNERNMQKEEKQKQFMKRKA